jgi:hypothetical protein
MEYDNHIKQYFHFLAAPKNIAYSFGGFPLAKKDRTINILNDKI